MANYPVPVPFGHDSCCMRSESPDRESELGTEHARTYQGGHAASATFIDLGAIQVPSPSY